MNEQNEKIESDGSLKSPFLTWVENFWNHHKWQFLAGLLALVVLTVSLVQCVGNGRGNDATVMYAGGCTLMGTVARDFETTVASFAEDGNGDGKILVGIGAYAIYTNAEIEANYKDESTRAYVKQTSYNNRESFDQEILAGEATLCFLSPSLFEELVASTLELDGEKVNRLLPVSEYATLPGESLVLYKGTGYGIRLSSLALSGYPGFSELPEDTVVCIRRNMSLNTLFGGSGAEAMYEANLALAKRLIAAPAYEAE